MTFKHMTVAGALTAVVAATVPTGTALANTPGAGRPAAQTATGRITHSDRLRGELRAHAAVGQVYYDVSTTIIVGCYAALDAYHAGGNAWYTRARFYSSTVSCAGWLSRSNYGNSFLRVSAIHTYDPGQWANTGWYYDGAGYQTHACARTDTFQISCTRSF